MKSATIRATVTNPASHLCGMSFDLLAPTYRGDAYKVVSSEGGYFDGLCFYARELSFAPVLPLIPLTHPRVSPLEANFPGGTPYRLAPLNPILLQWPLCKSR